MDQFEFWQIGIMGVQLLFVALSFWQNRKSRDALKVAEGKVDTQLDLMRKHNDMYRDANYSAMEKGKHQRAGKDDLNSE